MADSKITALASIGTGTDPANDPLVIVDVSDVSPGGMSATGTTKKVTLNNLLSSSPTATGNFTITGDLTVDTSTLYVSSSADKVGIGTTSLSNEKLTVAGNISANAWLGRSNISVPAGDCSIFRSADNTLGFGIASTTAMTLNATGLGVGGSPNISASGKALTISGAFTRSRLELQNTDGGTGGVTCGTISWFNGSNLIADITSAANSGSSTLGSLAFSTGGSPRLTIDSSGNVISNVTGTAPTLATNSQMVFNLTSNTNLRISVRGTDGTTRTANITLA